VHYIKQYNLFHSDSPIVVDLTETDKDGSLIRAIHKKLFKVCRDRGDWCWADQPFVKDDPIIQSFYKPQIPTSRYKWLATGDIDRVINQYAKLFPNFRYLGAVPLDFDQLRGYQLSSEDYCMHYNRDGKTKIGGVFNLDTHDKAGSHWVSMFCDLEHNYIAFFDSVGVKTPPKEIGILMENIKRQIERCMDHKLKKYLVNRPMKFTVNQKNIQKGNSECGVFCIYFILKCLLGEKPEDIFGDPNLNDNSVNYFRTKVFRPSIYSDNSLFKMQKYPLFTGRRWRER